jgi:hypothetical protein
MRILRHQRYERVIQFDLNGSRAKVASDDLNYFDGHCSLLLLSGLEPSLEIANKVPQGLRTRFGRLAVR